MKSKKKKGCSNAENQMQKCVNDCGRAGDVPKQKAEVLPLPAYIHAHTYTYIHMVTFANTEGNDYFAHVKDEYFSIQTQHVLKHCGTQAVIVYQEEMIIHPSLNENS